MPIFLRLRHTDAPVVRSFQSARARRAGRGAWRRRLPAAAVVIALVWLEGVAAAQDPEAGDLDPERGAAGVAVAGDPGRITLRGSDPFEPTDGYPRRSGFDVLHYEIRLDIPAEGRSVEGRTAIVFEALGPGLATLPLDFGALRVDSVSVAGRAAAFRHEGNRLEIDLPRLERHERGEAVVWYHGEPSDGLFIQPNRHGRRSVFADNWPNRARHWFPGVDHPSDKATVEFQVEAPAGLEVVSNGYLRGVEDLGGGRAVTRWSMTSEVPTYCMVIGAADFAVERIGVADGLEVSDWTFPEDSAAASAAFRRSAEIAAFFDSLFGPYPYEKLAFVQSSTRFGGMENSSAIFYDENAIGGEGSSTTGSQTAAPAGQAGGQAADDPSLSELIAHEVVHQWFGDAVTEADWHHLWLSEGFATYFAAVFFEVHGGPEGRGRPELARRMRAEGAKAIAHFRETGEPVYTPGQTDLFKLLNANNYEKGAWVLHMLRREVGDSAFFDGIRDYYAAYRNGTAWTADFQRVMEEASGQALGWFFAQWLERPGHPVLQVERLAGNAGRARLVIRQVQPGPPFRFPIDLELGWRSGTRLERVLVEDAATTLEVEVPEPLETVVIDPDGWLLHEARH